VLKYSGGVVCSRARAREPTLCGTYWIGSQQLGLILHLGDTLALGGIPQYLKLFRELSLPWEVSHNI